MNIETFELLAREAYKDNKFLVINFTDRVGHFIEIYDIILDENNIKFKQLGFTNLDNVDNKFPLITLITTLLPLSEFDTEGIHNGSESVSFLTVNELIDKYPNIAINVITDLF